MLKIKIYILIVLGLIFLGFVVANHIVYMETKKDLNVKLETYKENGLEVNYSVDYNILYNYLFHKRLYVNNIDLKTNVLSQSIKIRRLGIGDLDVENLNIQLEIIGLGLPLNVFYNENNMPPIFELYFSAIENIDLSKESVLDTSFKINVVDNAEQDVLNLDFVLDVESLLGASLHLRASGFEAATMANLMIQQPRNQEEYIQRQVLINEAYENIVFENFEVYLQNKGLADAIILETSKRESLTGAGEARALIYENLDELREQGDLNLVINELVEALYVFFE